MPAVLGGVNTGGTPVAALWVSVGIALACLATNTVNTMLALLSFLFVANYALTFTGLFVSRRRAPHAPRPFRVPCYPVVPGLALAGSGGFMMAAALTDPVNSGLALALLGVSWPIYRLVTRRTAFPPAH
jgi:APA family basic amino acid/polyamine antiporter